jgi:hypothetical protein
MGLRGTAAALVAIATIAVAAAAHGDVVGGANVRVSFHGWLSPRELPRGDAAPVSLHVKGSLRTTDGNEPPGLERVRIEINRHATVSTAGLPRCRQRWLEATTSRRALERCRASLIGTGTFRAHIRLPESAPFPAFGRLLAFNGVHNGRPAILAHVFGRRPIPTGQVLTLALRRSGRGTFGTTLTIRLPEVAGDWGHVTGFNLELHRLYRFRDRTRTVIGASCPAPAGFNSALFSAARGTYYLSDGRVIHRLVSGRCRVRSS